MDRLGGLIEKRFIDLDRVGSSFWSIFFCFFFLLLFPWLSGFSGIGWNDMIWHDYRAARNCLWHLHRAFVDVNILEYEVHRSIFHMTWSSPLLLARFQDVPAAFIANRDHPYERPRGTHFTLRYMHRLYFVEDDSFRGWPIGVESCIHTFVCSRYVDTHFRLSETRCYVMRRQSAQDVLYIHTSYLSMYFIHTK